MRQVMLPYEARPSLRYFSTLSHKGDEFRGGGKVTEHKICGALNFSETSVCNISHSKKNSDIQGVPGGICQSSGECSLC